MRPPLDLSLYLVTDTRLCGDRGVAATVAAAVRGGVSAVQLRDPDADARTLFCLGRAIQAELAGTGVPLIVNDRLDVALWLDADGVHLGQRDVSPETARRLLGPHAYVGLSVSRPEQLAHVPDAVDHLGVGPVFPQSTKPDADAPLGLDGLALIVRASPLPCVAIGGIGASEAAAAVKSGAAGIAVVSAVCGQPDPEAAARSLVHTLRKEVPA
ncbi:thiamine phosphate synthase [Streptomyces sp. NBC_01304]|uniref:thiamine phosphate synthase n=1 Tax=Streptomyces sp. NBC_01304 TaxID=2903818 RepID=UPI002E0F7630|nr:thiamine phosphate synthase [Streptomyces sp. NBC_01304]